MAEDEARKKQAEVEAQLERLNMDEEEKAGESSTPQRDNLEIVRYDLAKPMTSNNAFEDDSDFALDFAMFLDRAEECTKFMEKTGLMKKLHEDDDGSAAYENSLLGEINLKMHPLESGFSGPDLLVQLMADHFGYESGASAGPTPKILDAGAGIGRFGSLMKSKEYAGQLTALDDDATFAKVCREIGVYDNSVQACLCKPLPLEPNSFDCVVSAWTLGMVGYELQDAARIGEDSPAGRELFKVLRSRSCQLWDRYPKKLGMRALLNLLLVAKPGGSIFIVLHSMWCALLDRIKFDKLQITATMDDVVVYRAPVGGAEFAPRQAVLKLTKWTDDQLPAWCNGLASGMRVRLDGLKAKPELNGQEALVIGLKAEAERVNVLTVTELDNVGRMDDMQLQALAIKPANIEKI